MPISQEQGNRNDELLYRSRVDRARHRSVVNPQVTPATGTAERDAAGQILADVADVASRAITVSADKNYDVAGFVVSCRAYRITLHTARNDERPRFSVIDCQVPPSASKSASALSRRADGVRISAKPNRVFG